MDRERKTKHGATKPKPLPVRLTNSKTLKPKKKPARGAGTKFNKLFDSTRTGVCVIGKDFGVLRVNEKFSALSRVNADDAVGKKCYSLFSCNLRNSPGCALKRILAGKEKVRCRVERERRDGAVVELFLRATPLIDSAGQLVGIVEDFKKVHRRRREKQLVFRDRRAAEPPSRTAEQLRAALEQLQIAEEELHHQNQELMANREALEAERQRYHSLFEFAPDAYLLTDMTGNIREANRNAATMLNAPWDFLKDKPLVLFLPKGDREAFHTQLSRLTHLEQVDDWELRFQPRKGKPFHASVTVAVTCDSKGSPIGVYWLVHDITKRKRAEEALRENEEKYRGIFENSVVGIFTVDLAGNYTSCNPSALSLLRLPLDEVIGVSYREHVVRESWDFIEHEYNRVFRTDTPTRGLQYDIITGSGERRTIESDVCLLNKGKRAIGFQGTAIDITERKRTEQARLVSHRFLQIANRHGEMMPLLHEFLSEVKGFTGCDAVGIRILDEQRNIVCQVYDGFNKKFYDLESPQYIKSGACMCMNVSTGNVDPKLPYYTEGGSFYIDSVARLLEAPAEKQLNGSRNLCRKLGYETLATVPIRVENRILGLIHAADRRKGRISAHMVNILEGAAMQIGAAIVRVQMNETVSNALGVSQRRAEETSALLQGSRAILEYQEFDKSARAIFDSCKKLIGATAGFITLLSEDGAQNEIAVLDSGDLPCSVDLSLPLPTRGLFAEAYTLLKPVYENKFGKSPWSKFLPPGHAKIDNVLFAPLLLGEKPMGLIGLANKSGGFNVEDVRLVAAFAGQAAIALRNSLYLDALRMSEARYRNLSEKLEVMVREQVARVRQAESLAAIGRMVSVVAHEIRNPLQNVQMGVEAIRERMGEEKEDCEIFEEIDYGVSLLGSTIDELLDYAKPVKLERSPYPLCEIVKHALSLTKEELANITVSQEVEPADKKVRVDGGKMTRVLSNLIRNAADAMPNGGELKITAQVVEGRGASLLNLCVSDTGCGIREEDLARIQEPFVTLKAQGTGLGIPFCKKIIEAHNGTLEISSKPNQGTTVAITIPIKNP